MSEEAKWAAGEPVLNTRAGRELNIVYRNWRGEVRDRRVWPIEVWIGTSEWHQGEQWFLKAQDEENGEIRDFAMRDILRIA